MAELPDEVLFDFDTTELADWDPERSAQLLTEQPDLYRHHLTLAQGIEGWARRNDMRRSENVLEDTDFNQGFDRALLEIAAHLRQGDMMPGGALYEGWL